MVCSICKLGCTTDLFKVKQVDETFMLCYQLKCPLYARINCQEWNSTVNMRRNFVRYRKYLQGKEGGR